MRAVNLLPPDLERRRGEGGRAPLLVAAGGLAAVTAGAAVLFMSVSGTVTDTRSQLESVEAALARVPKERQPEVAPSAIAQERADRVAALAAALSTRLPVDGLLRELAFVLPEDAWLTGLSAAAPTATTTTGTPPGSPPAASSTAPGVTIQGATYSHGSVARVLARLAALPSLSDVRLATSALVEPAEAQGDAKKSATKAKPVVTFTITASLRSGGAA